MRKSRRPPLDQGKFSKFGTWHDHDGEFIWVAVFFGSCLRKESFAVKADGNHVLSVNDDELAHVLLDLWCHLGPINVVGHLLFKFV